MFKDLIEKINKIMFWKKKKECNHESAIYEKSNVLQLDDMGYPLRLCIRRCSNCGKEEQVWLDVSKQALEELKTGESVLCEWERIPKMSYKEIREALGYDFELVD